MERGSPGGWAWCVGWWVSWLCKVLYTPSPNSYSGHITLWPGSILESNVPEHDLSAQEHCTYGEAAWADLGCKYKTSSRYYYTTGTYIHIICKLVSVNSRNMCTYMYMYSCMLLHEFLIVELNLYTCIKVYSFFLLNLHHACIFYDIHWSLWFFYVTLKAFFSPQLLTTCTCSTKTVWE